MTLIDRRFGFNTLRDMSNRGSSIGSISMMSADSNQPFDRSAKSGLRCGNLTMLTGKVYLQGWVC